MTCGHAARVLGGCGFDPGIVLEGLTHDPGVMMGMSWRAPEVDHNIMTVSFPTESITLGIPSCTKKNATPVYSLCKRNMTKHAAQRKNSTASVCKLACDIWLNTNTFVPL